MGHMFSSNSAVFAVLQSSESPLCNIGDHGFRRCATSTQRMSFELGTLILDWQFWSQRPPDDQHLRYRLVCKGLCLRSRSCFIELLVKCGFSVRSYDVLSERGSDRLKFWGVSPKILSQGFGLSLGTQLWCPALVENVLGVLGLVNLACGPSIFGAVQSFVVF